jgi:NhaP-type Na+/H+ or K+/H+ antiporter
VVFLDELVGFILSFIGGMLGGLFVSFIWDRAAKKAKKKIEAKKEGGFKLPFFSNRPKKDGWTI